MSKYGSNPFVVNTTLVKIKAIKCFSQNRFISPDSIKIEDGIALPKQGDSFEGADFSYSFLVDQAKNCKVFQGDSCFELIKKLDSNGKTMFLYIQQVLKKNSDVIELSPDDYKKFANVTSSKTFYNAVDQLVDNSIIAKLKTHKYWVNPFVVFNGDRIEKYPDNVEIVAKVNLK